MCVQVVYKSVSLKIRLRGGNVKSAEGLCRLFHNLKCYNDLNDQRTQQQTCLWDYWVIFTEHTDLLHVW
jgi:hypothetical protein